MLEVHHHHPSFELEAKTSYIFGEVALTLSSKGGGEEQTKMGRNNHGKSPKVDQLKLNVSAKQTRARGGPSTRAVAPPQQEEEDESSSPPAISPPSSCVSSDGEKSGSPEANPMVLAGCPRCLMYVMLSEEEPKCPKCKSTVLLDFHPDGGGKNRRS